MNHCVFAHTSAVLHNEVLSFKNTSNTLSINPNVLGSFFRLSSRRGFFPFRWPMCLKKKHTHTIHPMRTHTRVLTNEIMEFSSFLRKKKVINKQ